MTSIRNTPSNNRRIKRHTLTLDAVPLPSETCNSIISGRGSVKTTSPPCRHGDNLVFRINRHSRRIANTSEKRRPITRHILNIALRYLRYNTSPINSVDQRWSTLTDTVHRKLRASDTALRIISCRNRNIHRRLLDGMQIILRTIDTGLRLIQSVDENLNLSVSQPTVTKLLLDGIQLRASLISGENIDLSLRQTEPLSQSRSVLDLIRSVILSVKKNHQILFARTTHERLHGTGQLVETRYVTLLDEIKNDFLLTFGQLKLVDIILNLSLHRIHVRQIELRGHVIGNKPHLVGERGGGFG